MILVLAGASAATVFAVAALAFGVSGFTAGMIWASTTIITLALGLCRLHRANMTQERLRSELERDHTALRQSQKVTTRPLQEITEKK